MAIPVPSISTAITNLLAQINAQVARDIDASQILVTLGEEGPDRPNDIINVATTIRFTSIPEVIIGSYAAGALLEEYEIDVRVSAFSGDPDPVAIIARALVLAGYVTTAVRADPSLGGLLIEAHPAAITGAGAEWTTGPEIGRICELVVAVHCTDLN